MKMPRIRCKVEREETSATSASAECGLKQRIAKIDPRRGNKMTIIAQRMKKPSIDINLSLHNYISVSNSELRIFNSKFWIHFAQDEDT